MAIKHADVVSQEAVAAVLEEQTRATYQFRRAFRNHDATNINNDEFNFPVPDSDLDGEVVEVPEGGNYPRSGTSDSKVTAVYTKYGLEVPITDEAVSDSRVDVEMNTQQNLMWAEEARMDGLAFGILNNNLNAAGPIGDDNGTITYADVSEARTTLWDDEYDVSSMIMLVEGGGWSDIEQMDEFTPASELGDYVVQNGLLPGGDVGTAYIGNVAGVPTYATNTGDLGDREAFIVDTSQYGYESTRWDRQISSYRDNEHDQDIHKIRTRVGFVATDSSAAIKITG